MIINNSIEFAELASKFSFNNTMEFSNYFSGWQNVCNCKPTLKNLYLTKMEKSYVKYVSSNAEHIKQKIGSCCNDDPIIIFKTYDKIFCTLQLN